jgi:hypothetical protein
MTITFKQLLESIATKHYGDWHVLSTPHSLERGDRTKHVSDADWDTFHQRAIKEIEGRTKKPYKDGEYAIHSRTLGDASKPGLKVIANVDQKKKQIRHITRLEPHMVPKVGTQTIKVESVEHEIIEIE